MSDEVFFTKKNSIAMRISREMALDYGFVEATPEEKAEREERTRIFRAGQLVARKQFEVAIVDLRATEDQLTLALLELHTPDLDAQFSPTCPGCDMSGGEAEEPDWPCRTIRTLADHHGIDLPDWSLPGTYYFEETA